MIQITFTEITDSGKTITTTKQITEGQHQAIFAVLDIQRIDLQEQGLKQMLSSHENEIQTISKHNYYEKL